MPRIVGGSAKGRTIRLPPGEVRPATARARKALFDYLGSALTGAAVLDLYCGSGGLGLEALSRGAAEAWFVDSSQAAIHTARLNGKSLGLLDRAHFACQDAFGFLRRLPLPAHSPFTLIFASPPYRIAEPERILEAVAATDAIKPDGYICLEYSRHTPKPTSSEFHLKRRKIYGETVVEVWGAAEN